MAETPRIGDLELDEDLRFQKRQWKVQRVAWVVWLVVLAAAVAGLFGSGPLSNGTAGEEGGPLWAEYHRFERYQGPSDLKVFFGPGAASGGEGRVWLARDYLESIELEAVTPTPLRVEAGADRHTYVFPVSDPQQGTSVVFRFRPEALGRHEARIGLPGGQELKFGRFVYP
jgi:hypothetical protein